MVDPSNPPSLRGRVMGRRVGKAKKVVWRIVWIPPSILLRDQTEPKANNEAYVYVLRYEKQAV